MSNLKGFCVMYTYDVAIDNDWNDSYTANRNQQSDNGEFIYVAGIRDGCYKQFYTSKEMFDWCYENGWSRQELTNA